MTSEFKYKSVSDVIVLIKGLFSRNCPLIYFQGEVSEPKSPPSGHFYFRLKDENSVIDAVIWAGVLARQSFRPAAGQKILCQGSPDVYNKSGRLQMVVSHILPAGEGDLQKKFLELKEKLTLEGLFASERKRQLPFFPKSIGLVTSPQGAVIHDMQVKFKERMPGVNLLLYPVSVQGPGSADEVISGIKYFNKNANVDLIIIARGGGSLEDLWTFNEEKVVRAVFGSVLPVISGIGHEPDITLCDLAADYRAPTPTAAAEKAVPKISELLIEVQDFERRINDLSRWLYPKMQQFDELKDDFASAYQNYFSILRERILSLQKSVKLLEPVRLLQSYTIRINNSASRLKNNYLSCLKNYIGEVDFLIKNLRVRMHDQMDRAAKNVLFMETRCRNINPRNILQRGYTLVRKDGDLITDVSKIHPKESLAIEFATGEVNVVVSEKRNI